MTASRAGKTPAPQAISALLSRAGFARSEPWPAGQRPPWGGRLRDGYRVTAGEPGQVRVCYWVGWKSQPAADPGALMFYAGQIRLAGWAADYGDQPRTFLIVTAPPAEES